VALLEKWNLILVSAECGRRCTEVHETAARQV